MNESRVQEELVQLRRQVCTLRRWLIGLFVVFLGASLTGFGNRSGDGEVVRAQSFEVVGRSGEVVGKFGMRETHREVGGSEERREFPAIWMVNRAGQVDIGFEGGVPKLELTNGKARASISEARDGFGIYISGKDGTMSFRAPK